MSDQLDTKREPLPTTSDVVPTPPRQQQQQQQHSMTNKEILEISRQILGSEHLALRIHLELTEAQAFALNEAFPNSQYREMFTTTAEKHLAYLQRAFTNQDRSYAMLKAWHDVVVESGENPRPLLAAAFVNASSNNLMARKVMGEGAVDAKASSKQATVDRIQKIIFRKDGYDCGDVDLSYDKNRTAHGHGGMNLYGCSLEVDGLISIDGPSQSRTVSNSLAHDGSQASLHSLNLYQSKVRVGPEGRIAIGSHSAPSSINSFIRGEIQNTVVDGPKPETSNNSASQVSRSGKILITL